MVVEELIAKLGLKLTGGNDTAKFIRELDKVKKAAKDAGKGLNFKIGGDTGLSRISGDAERAVRSLRKMREEAVRVSRVRIRPGIIPGGGGGGGGGGHHPGTSPGRAPARGGPSVVESVGGGGGLNIVATLGTLVATLNRFGNLEAAQVELMKTADKTKAETQPDIDRFLVEGPKLGTTAKTLTNTAGVFVAAGIDYKTAVDSALLTAKAATAGSVNFDDAAQAAVVTMQNLGVEVKDLAAAFDIFIKGGKLGKAEFKELAGSFPQLAASAGKSGIKGLKGTRDLIAATEIVREGSASTDQATTDLKDLLEKIIAPDVARHFKKEGGIDLKKELLKREKKGSTRLDAFLDILQGKTKGDEFELSKYLHEQQSRSAATALLKNRAKYEDYKKEIDREAPGTTATDLAKSMDTFNSSVERFGSMVDRLAVRAGEFLAPTARTGLDTVAAGQQAYTEGEKSYPAEAKATLDKMNKLFGSPPTYHGVFGAYGVGSDGMSPGDFQSRVAGMGGGPRKPSFMQKRPTGMQAPSFGSPADRMNWMSQGADKMAGVTNTTNNTNTGNDQRTQTASVTVNATGLSEVAALVKSQVQSGLAGMGASIVKGQSASTGASTAP